jgi:hypothetical protein
LFLSEKWQKEYIVLLWQNEYLNAETLKFLSEFLAMRLFMKAFLSLFLSLCIFLLSNFLIVLLKAMCSPFNPSLFRAFYSTHVDPDSVDSSEQFMFSLLDQTDNKIIHSGNIRQGAENQELNISDLHKTDLFYFV